MTEVSFYVCEQQGSDAFFQLTERLIQGIWRRRRHIYVHGDSEDWCRQLDARLWKQPGFLPHSLIGEKHAPIMLGWQDVPDNCHDVLINASGSVPDFFSRFERVVEPVGFDEHQKQQSRAHWQHYKSRGYPVQKHNI